VNGSEPCSGVTAGGAAGGEDPIGGRPRGAHTKNRRHPSPVSAFVPKEAGWRGGGWVLGVDKGKMFLGKKGGKKKGDFFFFWGEGGGEDGGGIR